MPYATVGDLELWYDTFGHDEDVPVLLISGLGSQCIRWDDKFCQGLADRYLRVIRFDNRDIGLSSRVDGPDDVMAVLAAMEAGEDLPVPYTLSDMAADAVGVLDALGIDKAHIVGMSMGGMIAQLVALEHRERVSSLTSIMSSTSNPEVGQPTPEAIEALLTPSPTDRDGAIAHDLRLSRIWGSPDYYNEDYMRDLFGQMFDRGGPDKSGNARQSCATVAAPPRDEALRQLQCPTLVIHGALDPLINVDGGEHTAEIIEGATLLVIENMSHDWPPELFGPIIEAITQHVIASAA